MTGLETPHQKHKEEKETLKSNWTNFLPACFLAGFWTSSVSLSFYFLLVQKFSGLSRECCVNGITRLDGFSCLYRSKFIVDEEECQKAFLHCCTEVTKHRKAEAEVEFEARMNLARSRFFLSSITIRLQFFCLMLVCMCTFSRKKWVAVSFMVRNGCFSWRTLFRLWLTGEMEEFVNSDSIVTRTLFPESWLWEEVTLPKCPSLNPNWCGIHAPIVSNRWCFCFNKCFSFFSQTTSVSRVGLHLKDSITTWEITAISLSKTHGMTSACISFQRVASELKSNQIYFELTLKETLNICQVKNDSTVYSNKP